MCDFNAAGWHCRYRTSPVGYIMCRRELAAALPGLAASVPVVEEDLGPLVEPERDRSEVTAEHPVPVPLARPEREDDADGPDDASQPQQVPRDGEGGEEGADESDEADGPEDEAEGLRVLLLRDQVAAVVVGCVDVQAADAVRQRAVEVAGVESGLLGDLEDAQRVRQEHLRLSLAQSILPAPCELVEERRPAQVEQAEEQEAQADDVTQHAEEELHESDGYEGDENADELRLPLCEDGLLGLRVGHGGHLQLRLFWFGYCRTLRLPLTKQTIESVKPINSIVCSVLYNLLIKKHLEAHVYHHKVSKTIP